MRHLATLLPAALALLTIAPPPARAADAATRPVTLRRAAQGHFLVGCAVMAHDLDDPNLAALIAAQFDCLTPENEMKPLLVHPRPNVFDFANADRLVDFAQAHDMKVVGHCLVWHQQSPAWLFEDEHGKPLPRDAALANMKRHIQTVMRHYKGRVKGWDVVNEAVADSGPYLRDTPALRAIGEDYVAKAFQFAREADPDVELYYNDYNIERDYKRDKAVRLLKSLDDAGVRPTALGIQGHWLLGDPPPDEIERGVKTFQDLGYKLMFTEVDVDPLPRDAAGADLDEAGRAAADPYRDGLTPEAQRALTSRYGALTRLILGHDADVTRVTFWGTHDGHSWLNGFPVPGRTNHPLLFDRRLRPKPAFDAVVDALDAAPAPSSR